MKIAVVVSVAGDPMYFRLAKKSISSFLRNNMSADLFVFTNDVPRIDKLKGPLTGRLHIVDYERCFRDNRKIINSLSGGIISQEKFDIRGKETGYTHNHMKVAALPPIAEKHLTEMNYEFILKIDVDSYFAGGDFFPFLREDLHRNPGYDLYLVERAHKLMWAAPRVPGTGFVLWRMGGEFVPKYLETFHRLGKFQGTIQRLAKNRVVNAMILKRPGYHFVYPFLKGGFTKEKAESFLPAYFHLYERNRLENQKTLEGWFG